MILAGDLKLGDMVSLHEDPVFDPNCEDRWCIHLTQNAEVHEIEPRPDGEGLTIVFKNQPGSDPETGIAHYVGSVPPTYAFVDPQ